MRPTVHLIVGIHGILGGVTRRNWLVDFDRHLALHLAPWELGGGDRVHLLDREYKAAPLPIYNRHVKNPLVARSYVRDIRAELAAWSNAGYQVKLYFVTHSNGANVAVLALPQLAALGIRVEAALFIAAAIDSRPRETGLDDLVARECPVRAVAWWSSSDRIIAPRQHYPGPYGSLGARGWEGLVHPRIAVTDPPSQVMFSSREFPGYGHGRYFDRDVMDRTFDLALLDLGLAA